MNNLNHIDFYHLPPQQISRHQEQFIHMLNEPSLEGGGQSTGEVVTEAGGGMNYIQVTPQEKEAIERVGIASSLAGYSLLLLQ